MTNLALNIVLRLLGLSVETVDGMMMRHRGTANMWLHEEIDVKMMIGIEALPLESDLTVLREIQEHELMYMYPYIYIDRHWSHFDGKRLE